MHDVYLDASNSGAGYVFATDWGYTNWSKDMPSVGSFHINDREILAAVLAARRWAPLWVNSQVLFHIDNITARAALRKGSARSPAIMPYLRELFWLSALFNFHIDACFIPGVLNDTIFFILCPLEGQNLAVAKKQINSEHLPDKCTHQVWIGLHEYFFR